MEIETGSMISNGTCGGGFCESRVDLEVWRSGMLKTGASREAVTKSDDGILSVVRNREVVMRHVKKQVSSDDACGRSDHDGDPDQKPATGNESWKMMQLIRNGCGSSPSSECWVSGLAVGTVCVREVWLHPRFQ